MPASLRSLLPLAALVALAAAPGDADPNGPVKRGVDLWEAKDYSGAVAAWRGPAEAGDADAEFNLGQAYKLGNGVPADLRQAELWYRKAAEQGHDKAEGLLGVVMFQNGDHAGAVPWLKTAAEHGDPRAAYVYGTMLFNADNVAKDWPLAYAYMTRASAAGLPQARSSLAQMDQFIPAPQRKRGLALARDMGRGTPGREGVAASAPPPPSSGSIRPAPLPPSVAAMPPPPARVASAPPPKPHPAPKPTPVAVAAPPARGGAWRVQLGAFSNEAGAREAWAKYAAKPGLHGLRPSFIHAGAVVRLQAGMLPDRAQAAKACQVAGNGCFPVAP